MSIEIQVPHDQAALERFLEFRDVVYASRAVRWPTFTGLLAPMIAGDGPFAVGRRFRPFLALEGGVPSARAVAVVDERYIEHWGEKLGHIILYESLPHAREASRAALDAACAWLREQGMEAARAGYGIQEFPFVTDDYDSLPAGFLRHNPPEYHTLLKDAGFEAERGWVDYKIQVTPELVERYEKAVAGAEVAGFEIVRLRDVDPARRLPEFAALWNHAFAEHWGNTPFSEDDWAMLFSLLEPLGMFETSVLAYRDGEPVGVLWVTPDPSVVAVAERPLRDDEKVNFLGIGVHRSARGRGLGVSMASHAYLELIRRGSTWLSYTLVRDDNWPSRRTASKLGARVISSLLTYRRNFSRP